MLSANSIRLIFWCVIVCIAIVVHAGLRHPVNLAINVELWNFTIQHCLKIIGGFYYSISYAQRRYGIPRYHFWIVHMTLSAVGTC